MPTPEPTATSPLLTYLTAAVGGLMTLVLSLIAYIARGFKQTQEGQQDQLDAGVEEFRELKLENERRKSEILSLKAEIASLRKWLIDLEKDIDLHDEELRQHHDFILKVTERHKMNHGDQL